MNSSENRWGRHQPATGIYIIVQVCRANLLGEHDFVGPGESHIWLWTRWKGKGDKDFKKKDCHQFSHGSPCTVPHHYNVQLILCTKITYWRTWRVENSVHTRTAHIENKPEIVNMEKRATGEIKSVRIQRAISGGYGFSLMGGKGTEFPPVICDILEGSPASKCGDVSVDMVTWLPLTLGARPDTNVTNLTCKNALMCCRPRPMVFTVLSLRLHHTPQINSLIVVRRYLQQVWIFSGISKLQTRLEATKHLTCEVTN